MSGVLGSSGFDRGSASPRVERFIGPILGVVIARAVAAAKSGADTQQCPTELGSETASL